MAEVAGLVIGGVSLLASFDACMTTFNRLDTGRNCSRDYQHAAVDLALLAERLERWEEAYRESKLSDTTMRQGILAEAALGTINESLESIAIASDRYEPQGDSDAVASLTDSLQALTFAKRTKQTVKAKIVWALRDQKKFQEVTITVRSRIEELEKMTISLAQAREQKAQARAEELLKSGSIKEPETTIRLLKQRASELDPDFEKGASKSTGHQYGHIINSETSTSHQGNTVAPGYQGPFSGAQHTYGRVENLGNSRSQQGDIYGGKGVFD